MVEGLGLKFHELEPGLEAVTAPPRLTQYSLAHVQVAADSLSSTSASTFFGWDIMQGIGITPYRYTLR